MSLWSLLKLTLAALLTATIAGQVLRRFVRSEQAAATVADVNLRIGAWWVLCGLVGLALTLGQTAAIALFAILSWLAYREFASVVDFQNADRRALYWIALAFTAAQYALVWNGRYYMLMILVPMCAVLFFPARVAALSWGLLICTYCVSYAPALLTLEISGYAGRNATLLFYFLLVIQSSDVLQYIWGKLLGRRRLAPGISPNKTWEGLIGGIVTSTALGTVLYRATPFQPWQAAAICAAITLTGVAGGLIMSAIKRRRGVKDFGAMVVGHGGVLDRLDSICLSAPVFFYLVRHFYAVA